MATSNDQVVLNIQDLNISYYTRAGEIPAVVDFSLQVRRGETIGLVGESGCGKSTVAMAIMQYMGNNGSVKSGSIEFKGREMTRLSEEELRQIRGKEISMIYQEPFSALNPSMLIVNQLIEVPLAHENISVEEARARARQILVDVNIPDPDRVLDSYPHQLSGGQQQRVVIAMGLLSNPDLLLLDEPTTALDVTVEAGIVKLIANISKKFGTSQIYISHNLGLILETCDRVFVMYSGEVVEEGAIRPLFKSPRHPYTHGLFGCIALPTADKNAAPLVPIRGQLPLPHERPQGCNFGPRCDYFVAGRCDQQDIHMEDVGDDAEARHAVRCVRWVELEHERKLADSDQQAAEVGHRVLEVHNMQKYYTLHDRSIKAMMSGDRIKLIKANEKLDFEAHESETLAIVGESGYGKSTLAKVLLGLETATDGEILLNGEKIDDVPVNDRSPAQLSAMQMVFQNPSDTLNPSHTVGQQIARAIKKFGVEKNRTKVREMVLSLLDTVKLPRDFYYRRPRQLSGGQKQRIGIARAFAGRPSMIIADEPVSALDVSVAAAITELLMDLQRERKMTLLFISHDLSIVRYLSDRILVMYLGQVMEQGETQDVFQPPYHPYTEALLSAVPIADPDVNKREIVLEGNLPSVLNPPPGCPFETRCPRKIGEICENVRPPIQNVSANHQIACHIPLEELREVDPVIQMGNKGSSEVSATVN